MTRATMNARDAAAYIGCSYWKILEIAKAGEIPHAKIGNRIIFRRETLDNWMEEQEVKSVRQEDMQGYGKLRALR